MSDEPVPPKPRQRRIQTNTERDHEGLQARRVREQEARAMEAEQARQLAEAAEESSDGTPSEDADEGDSFGSLTPPPFDPEQHPLLHETWLHANKNYQRAADKVLKACNAMGATGNIRKTVSAHEKTLQSMRITMRVAQIIGGVLIAVFGIVGGLGLHALYTTGIDKGSIDKSLLYMSRDIERNHDADLELRKMLDKLVDTLSAHERDHNSSRRGRNTSPATGTSDPPSSPVPTHGGDPP